MARRKKHAQYKAQGCAICGDDTIGRGIARHVTKHGVAYDQYTTCFGSGAQILVNEIEQTGTRNGGRNRVMVHILVRKFVV